MTSPVRELLAPDELGRHCFFAAMGGSGSTYLIERLRQRFSVGNKPDTAFRNDYPELRTATDQGSFLCRSGGYSASSSNLEEVLPGYLQWVQKDNRRVTVLNTCAELGLLSAYRVPGVVFLIRHPFHAYGSFIKPERHLADVAALGGPESDAAIDWFAMRWVRVVQEAERLRRMGLLGALVRYEFAPADAMAAGVTWVFDDFDVTRRNVDAVGQSAEERLRAKVVPDFFHYYADWRV